MANDFKIKKNWIIILCILLGSLSAFAQDYSDQEIGFDVNRETLFLQTRGLNTADDLTREIDRMREMYKAQYIQMKKSEEELLQRIQPKQLLKSTANIIDVSQSEKEALKALYESTNGSKWKNNTGWDFSTPVTSWNNTTKTGWYGLIVDNGHVVDLSFSTNNINGFIPTEIGQLKYLKRLNLSYGQLTGSIPQEIGELVNLEILGFLSNKLSGSLPQGFYNLKSLVNLSINENQLSGELSPEINKLSNLTYLYAQKNQFSGHIPPQIGDLQKLISINFAYNQLTDSLPPEIGQLSNLTYFNLINNQLTGSIPAELGKLKSVINFYLTNNKLTGPIPPELGLLKKVRWMSIDYNELSGTIPEEITKLSVDFLSLNNNLFEGILPVFKNLYSLDIRSNNFRFIDLANQLTLYRTKTEFSPQTKTDAAKTITSSIGGSVTLTMYEDERFTPEDTYQWLKNGTEIIGAINRTYTIPDLKSADNGSYTCKSYHNSNPNMSPLILEREPIILNIVNCTSISGTMKSLAEKSYTNLESTFIFETTATNLIYSWSVATVAGKIINTNSANTSGVYSYKFIAEEDYIITLIVTDASGCSATFTKPVKVIDRHCTKEAVNFIFEHQDKIQNYNWSSTNAASIVVNTITNTTGLYTFIPELPGEYVIKLKPERPQDCGTIFSKEITVEDCTHLISCTKTNIYTPEIHRLFITLINKLGSTPNGSDVNIYAKKEIAALSPYTTHLKTKIYNFTNTKTEVSFSFSENETGNDVQIPKSALASVVSIDLSNYEDALTKITVAAKFSNGSYQDGYIQNINFCVTELSCVSHIALVLDESGSIATTEFNKIKKQLKAFVLQQAATNDTMGSNIYVSLTGMSDSDENTRIDFIKPIKLTNTPLVINQFNNWIDGLGLRNGKIKGISASSDYWRSGLEGALSYSMKPDVVIMITDGCQTADVSGLKTIMRGFNNAPGSNPNLPHLYVVGIEKGFYVDENFYTNKDSDPNLTQGILTNTVTTHLAKSLKYLFDYPDTIFPKSDINQFDSGTYFGHPNFSLLGSDNTYFSDKLADSEIVCGTSAKKDFCDDCLSFKPEPGKEYLLSAWVKEELFAQVKTYENPVIKIVFYNNKEALDIKSHKIDSLSVKASGNIIDGWQRVVQKFKIPINTITIGIQLENSSSGVPVYFDDIRIHPLQGSIKSFVYDPETFKLMAELDENNYGTFYEYDNEGGLVRVKKETENGIRTIQETRSGSAINIKP
ncbi:hypothetical protein [[Flexibacter] sp. ATCC 35103]|uniref:hypothetical protein n=1 Tax=[Flexibacter] sp. ATCC 35103 TaxID=1937528 RepID=UPI0009D06B60|nr:hypothetical protein [[Flexibacter] sp. ATCC 35103]OMQ09302.1 hypothetical protein BXU01_18235 [[Flexibacter] sp. ATCC 35103]OMQ09309.1 hypothetical protein BXU01_18270 [[Flexibacter] sp. ATCC 35103]